MQNTTAGNYLGARGVCRKAAHHHHHPPDLAQIAALQIYSVALMQIYVHAYLLHKLAGWMGGCKLHAAASE
jgi:hypothetical protein